MRILMIAPYTGGIDVYVSSLAKMLKSKFDTNIEVMGGGQRDSAYDINKKGWRSSKDVQRIARNIAERIPFSSFDIVAFHYGKNDIEQYLPVIIDQNKIPISKKVYFVHFLSRNLFDQYLNDSQAQNDVESKVATFFDGYVFFGNYAKQFMRQQYNKSLEGIVNYLPETHSLERDITSDKVLKEFYYTREMPTVYLPGFAANYKDHELLLSSFKYVNTHLNFVFAGLGWKKRLGFTKSHIGNVQIQVVEKYLNSEEYHFLTEHSLFGIFPYQQPTVKGEYFQGSGTLPNFIYAHKACIVLDEGAMAEYVGSSGIVAHNNDRDFADAINKMLNSTVRLDLEKKAVERAHLFSLEEHARKCFEYFVELA